MVDKNYTLAMKIKNEILSNFPSLDINVYFDNESVEYFISTRNKEQYYSDEYGKLVFKINQKYLWGQGIFNFYFILDESKKETDKLANFISFSTNNEIHYISWDINNTNSLLIDEHTCMDSFALAA